MCREIQAARDVERDTLCVNGVLVVGSEGYSAVVGRVKRELGRVADPVAGPDGAPSLIQGGGAGGGGGGGRGGVGGAGRRGGGGGDGSSRFSSSSSSSSSSLQVCVIRRSIDNRMKFLKKREASPLYRRALLRCNCVRARFCILGKTSQRNKL